MGTIFFTVAWATMLFCVSVSIKSGLRTSSIDQQYWCMVKLIEYLSELNVVMDEEPTEYRTNLACNEAPARRFVRVEECGALPSEDRCTPRAA